MKKRILLYFMLACITVTGFSQNTINNPFFEQVAYRGAFGTSGDWTSGWANWDPQNTVYGATDVNVTGELTVNTTWSANHVYLLQGFYYVRDGVTLTIEPGTVIRGDKATKGTLLIERGAKLIAEGTLSQPIVFTSNIAPGSRGYGDWGGVVLCGKASINVAGGTSVIEGGPSSEYGGGTSPNDADNSGSLKYVRIEYPGIPFVADKEINGLTLGGVGSGTQLEYIQVSYSGDDSFEWFGGTVNAKHLIVFHGWDDEYDTDFGFRGMIQFAVGIRDSQVADPGSSNGFESDNDATGSTNTPVTQPIFSNVSLFGPKVDLSTAISPNFKRAMHLRRNSRLNAYNSVFAGWPTGLFIDGTASQANATNGDLKIQNSVLSGMGTNFTSQFETDFFSTVGFKNETFATNDLLLYTDPFNYTQPNLMLQSSSPLKTGSYWFVTGIKDRKKVNAFSAFVYPNPVSDNATIRLNLVKAETLSINLYDMTGRKIANISNNQFNAGQNEVNYDASDHPKGIYFIQITDGVNSSSFKMMVN